MQERKVTLLIDENGQVHVDVEGVKGHECVDLTADVEDALGAVTVRVKKPEYSAIVSNAAVKQQIRG